MGKSRDVENSVRYQIITVIIGLFCYLAGSGVILGAPPPGVIDEPAAELVTTNAIFSRTAASPGETHPAALVVTVADGWHINSAQPKEDWLIAAELTFDTTETLIPFGRQYPVGHDVSLMGEIMSVYEGQTVIPFSVRIAETAADGEYTVRLHFTYQPCNDRECRAPQTDTVQLAVAVGPNGEATAQHMFSTETEKPTRATGDVDGSATETSPPTSDLQRLIDRHGFWGYFIALGLAFITGLLLSFSPCTYPMIPITVSVFAGQDRTVGKGFALSLFYVGSMALVYGLMGLVVSLVGGVFGAWLASPPVVIGIAVVFVIFALSMFGLYELQVPAAIRNKLGGAQSGGGVGGAIVLGIVAALVISPCVGPFVAGILLYIATSGSPVLGFLVLFIFALGLGTLFVIIGTFSTAINKLPNAGLWMESVNKFFGFVLLLMALYFIRTIVSPTIIAVLAGLLLTALGVFGGGLDRLTPETSFFGRVKKFVGVLALLIGLYLLLGTIIMRGLILPPAAQWLPMGGSGTMTAQDVGIPWNTDLEEGLALASEEDKPVLIDTWATWCTNCKVLEKRTFSRPAVIAEAEYFVPLKIQLEKSNSPETRAFMERFGLKQYSLPTTLLLNSEGEVEKILIGVVGPDKMIAEMRAVRN